MFFGVSLQGVPGFLHPRQTSLGVCEILVLGNSLLKIYYQLLERSLQEFYLTD